MGKYIVIDPDFGAKIMDDGVGDTPSLELMQKCVGGSIEHVSPVRLPDGLDMFCNETGKLTGMRHNLIASALYVTTFDCIVGPVCIFAHDDEGESHWLSEDQIRDIMLRIYAITETEYTESEDSQQEQG